MMPGCAVPLAMASTLPISKLFWLLLPYLYSNGTILLEIFLKKIHFFCGDTFIRKNVTTNRPCKKLDWKNGKYTVLEVISSHNYKLDTPPGIHNVFHTSLLKRTANNLFPNQRRGDFRPPAVMVNGEEE